MSRKQRGALAGVFVVLVGPFVVAPRAADDAPKPHVPRTPLTRAQIDQREALRLYALAALQERRNRLLEAVATLEDAHKLDPAAAPVLRSLIGLYLAIDRTTDALTACEKVLRQAPGDYRTGHQYARLLRTLERDRAAATALRRALRSPRLKDHPDAEAQMWFDLSALQERGKDLKAAEHSLRQVASILSKPGALVALGGYSREQIDIQLSDTYEKLGRLCLDAGRVDQAARDFAKARRHDVARGARLAFHLAQGLHASKRDKEALAELETYLRGTPQGTEGFELKVKLLRLLGRAADVVPELEKASAADRHNYSLKLLLAREYRAAGKPAAAKKVYLELLKEHVKEEVYRGLFAVEQEEGEKGVEAILARLDDAAEGAIGDDKRPASRVEAAKAQAMMTALRDDAALVRRLLPAAMKRLEQKKLGYATRSVLAGLAQRTKQLGEAERLYRACLDRPGGPGALEAEVYLGLLRVLRRGYKHAAIVEVCQEGLKTAQQTNRVLFHTEMAMAHQALGQDKEAVAAADLAVKDSGKAQDLLSRLLRADVLSVAGRHKEALAECQALLKAYNQSGEVRDVRVRFSNVLQNAGKLDEAEQQLRKLLEASANDALVCNNLGYLLAERNKDLDEAERLIRRALELDKQLRGASAVLAEGQEDNAAYVDSLGWVLFRRGKLDEARAELERASKLDDGEDDPVVWDHLGDVYYRLKEPAKARAAWRQALVLYDKGARRKATERYKEIEGKLRRAKP